MDADGRANGTYGSSPSTLANPVHAVADENENVYVTDWGKVLRVGKLFQEMELAAQHGMNSVIQVELYSIQMEVSSLLIRKMHA